jgi:hypothetical protein
MARTIAIRVAIGLVLGFCVLYICDYCVLHARMVHGGTSAALDTVSVTYGAALKDGRAELFPDQSGTVTCSRSIFPQMGYSPCWYARRHATQIISRNLTGGFRRSGTAVPYASPMREISAQAENEVRKFRCSVFGMTMLGF